ncbi:MAG: Rieske 2Fe-2S domain-containing protein [Parvibaculaceae bacterium]
MGAIQQNATSFNPGGLPMHMAATYEREIAASITRAWENVLDWEHLPHLHSSSFSSLELEEAGAWGWRAVTRGVPAREGDETRIELVVDRPKNRYVSRTLEGGLPGMEIWTRFTELAPRQTRVQVEFHIPHVSETDAAKLGRIMTDLYTVLWDEDERMMVERQQALDARAAAGDLDHIDLGPIATLPERLPQTVEFSGRTVNLVAVDGEIRAYHAECPHMLAPLAEVPPDADGCVTCPWHGYRFDIRTGCSADGRDLRMKPAFRVVEDAIGHARLVWAGPAED